MNTLFAYPWMLAAMVPAALIYYYWSYRKPQPGVILPDVSYAGHDDGRHWQRVAPRWTGFWFGLALLILVVALARPRIGDERLVVRNQGIDMMMVLDLSGSMGAVDVPRSITTEKALQKALESGQLKNRLEVAKTELSKFIAERPNDRIGLVGFAEYGFNLAPPTLDHDWLTASLAPLQPGIIGDATGIASPVASAIRRLADSNAPRRVLVLFTDGKNNVAHRLTPLATAELAKEKNVTIYTVGIGGNNAYMLQEGFFGKRFVPYPGEFDEKLLREMAARTDGRYFHAADEDGMREVMEEINRLEKTNFEQPRYVEYREFAPALAGLAAILILLGIWSENTRDRLLP